MHTRRHFLAASSSAFIGVQILPRNVLGANEKMNIAFIGAGGKGGGSIRSLANNPMVNLAAFADVDERRSADSRKAHPEVPFHTDLRQMLDRHGKGIDGVVVSTPDHTHHFAAMCCLKAGKPVYVEKPLAHSIAEVRDLMALEKETGLACQMGNQGHSGAGIVMLEAWAKAGLLGEVNEAHAWSGALNSVDDVRPPEEAVPAELDWNRWIGPAAMVPYSSRYMPGKWRCWFEFGCGTLGDWACHNMDAPYTVWELDCPSRVEIETSGPKKLSFPDTVRVTFTFPTSRTGREFKIHWYHGKNHAFTRPPELDPERELSSGGTFVRGSKAALIMGTHAGTPRVIPELKMRELAPDLPKVATKRSSHYENWLLSIQGRETCRSNFAYAARLTEAIHYGNIALHVHRNLTIDPKTRTILGDEEAASLMHGPAPRDGWKV